MKEINKRIADAKVKTADIQTAPSIPDDRPEILVGSTYKVKSPGFEHAMYVTINDFIAEDGTRLPYEIFINSKNMDNFQWIIAMTVLISAVFQKGGEVAFMAEALKTIFDPKGGYFKKKIFMPSIVAEIGYVLEQHFIKIGLLT